jgi:3-oxoacyl-[acyl-carrier-protein] synthase III
MQTPDTPNDCSALSGGIGVRSIAFHWGEQYPIAELPQLAQDPKRLAAFEARGFKKYTRSALTLQDQAVRCCKATLRRAQLTPADIDAVVIGYAEHRWFDDLQERLGGDILRGLGMPNTHVVGVTLGGCTNYTSLLRMARSLVISEGYRHVLVVETNKCHADGHDRLVMPDASVFSDGAASCVVTRERPEFLLRSLAQVTTPVPPNWLIGGRASVAHRVASSRFVFERALRQAGVVRDDIKQFFFPNHGTHMQGVYVARLGIPVARLHTDNLYWIAHPWSADTIINLQSYTDHYAPTAGDLFAIVSWSEFSFTTVVLERTAERINR